jgi:hypothetical protein
MVAPLVVEPAVDERLFLRGGRREEVDLERWRGEPGVEGEPVVDVGRGGGEGEAMTLVRGRRRVPPRIVPRLASGATGAGGLVVVVFELAVAGPVGVAEVD